MKSATAFTTGILLSSVLLLSACGGQSYTQSRSRQSANFTTGTSNSTTTTDGGSSSDSDTSDTTASLGVPALSMRAGAIGYTSVSVTVKARSLLKVRFTPGIQDRTVSGSGFSPKYSGLGVYITVGDHTEMTSFLYNGLYGGEAENSEILDFSNSFPRACASSDPSCKETVTITVSQPNYDYWCVNFGYSCGYWTRVETSHPWHGTLKIQTESTDPIQ
ncbi:MAG: hypothetical protein NDJ90_10345 [Oligoflexia bacterium]|nr:hypothetical protein [Oligoflexia bacterium]